jgi:hypothetical protein
LQGGYAVTWTTAWPQLSFDDAGVISGPWAGGGGLHNFLEAEGYQHGAPHDRGASADEQAVDQQVAETTPCAACHAVSGRYEAFTSPGGETRVSVAICGVCGYASTF